MRAHQDKGRYDEALLIIRIRNKNRSTFSLEVTFQVKLRRFWPTVVNVAPCGFLMTLKVKELLSLAVTLTHRTSPTVASMTDGT